MGVGCEAVRGADGQAPPEAAREEVETGGHRAPQSPLEEERHGGEEVDARVVEVEVD